MLVDSCATPGMAASRSTAALISEFLIVFLRWEILSGNEASLSDSVETLVLDHFDHCFGDTERCMR
jgi:hypothetical protein